MIVWGGWSFAGTVLARYGDGAEYSPSTDTWRPVNSVGAPTPRRAATAVWTGSEMIVWGGLGKDPDVSMMTTGAVATGARYDPASQSWTPTASVGAPSARSDHSAVWTGTKMIVWGGRDEMGMQLATGGEYDPTLDTWTPLPDIGAPQPRYGHYSVWTGSEMLIYGGSINTGQTLSDGAQYDPVSQVWSPMAPGPGRTKPMGAFVDDHLFVVGGLSQNPLVAYSYDLPANTWTQILADPPPQDRYGGAVVGYAGTVITWGGLGLPVSLAPPLRDGSVLDTHLLTWQPVSTINAPAARSGPAVVWTGAEMLLWGGGAGTTALGDGARFTP